MSALSPFGELVGIVGGIGPAATALLLQLIVEARGPEAEHDHDHVPVLAYTNPQVPNNRLGALGEGPSPVPAMVETVKRLAAGGATRFAIACNTAHYFAQAVAAEAPIPFLDMVQLTAEQAVETLRAIALADPSGDRSDTLGCVGIMSTDATIKLEIFHKAIRSVSVATFGREDAVQLEIPDADEQKRVQQAILNVKAGRVAQAAPDLRDVATSLKRRGCSLIITACTEIPVALPREWYNIDPMRILAGEPRGFDAPMLIDPMRILAGEIVSLTLRSRIGDAHE